MIRLVTVMCLCMSLMCSAQDLTDAPQPKPFYRSTVFWANAAMWGSSALAATGSSYGSRQCVYELLQDRGSLQSYGTSAGGGQTHPYKRTFTITLPIDGAISLSSYFLHRHHHNLAATLLPSMSAASQASVAGELYLQGCI